MGICFGTWPCCCLVPSDHEFRLPRYRAFADYAACLVLSFSDLDVVVALYIDSQRSARLPATSVHGFSMFSQHLRCVCHLGDSCFPCCQDVPLPSRPNCRGDVQCLVNFGWASPEAAVADVVFQLESLECSLKLRNTCRHLLVALLSDRHLDDEVVEQLQRSLLSGYIQPIQVRSSTSLVALLCVTDNCACTRSISDLRRPGCQTYTRICRSMPSAHLCRMRSPNS